MRKSDTNLNRRSISPNAKEAQQARDAARAFEGSVSPRSGSRSVRITANRGTSEPVVVPERAFRLFVEILKQIAKGNAVTVLPTHQELTTQEAADLLGVSRPYLVKLLEQNEIQHHRVGIRRRVKFEHLLAYLQKTKGESRDALAQLAEQAQDLGMGY